MEWHKKDRYGRTVGKVTVNRIDCGLVLVEYGLAWHYKAYEREQTSQDRDDYARAEKNAKEIRIGLWSELDFQAPWDFRHRKRADQ